MVLVQILMYNEKEVDPTVLVHIPICRTKRRYILYARMMEQRIREGGGMNDCEDSRIKRLHCEK